MSFIRFFSPEVKTEEELDEAVALALPKVQDHTICADTY